MQSGRAVIKTWWMHACLCRCVLLKRSSEEVDALRHPLSFSLKQEQRNRNEMQEIHLRSHVWGPGPAKWLKFRTRGRRATCIEGRRCVYFALTKGLRSKHSIIAVHQIFQFYFVLYFNTAYASQYHSIHIVSGLSIPASGSTIHHVTCVWWRNATPEPEMQSMFNHILWNNSSK